MWYSIGKDTYWIIYQDGTYNSKVDGLWVSSDDLEDLIDQLTLMYYEKIAGNL